MWKDLWSLGCSTFMYLMVLWETRDGKLGKRWFPRRSALQAAEFLATKEKRSAIVHQGRLVYSSTWTVENYMCVREVPDMGLVAQER